jgi:hypothetical protein
VSYRRALFNQTYQAHSVQGGWSPEPASNPLHAKKIWPDAAAGTQLDYYRPSACPRTPTTLYSKTDKYSFRLRVNSPIFSVNCCDLLAHGGLHRLNAYAPILRDSLADAGWLVASTGNCARLLKTGSPHAEGGLEPQTREPTRSKSVRPSSRSVHQGCKCQPKPIAWADAYMAVRLTLLKRLTAW